MIIGGDGVVVVEDDEDESWWVMMDVDGRDCWKRTRFIIEGCHLGLAIHLS